MTITGGTGLGFLAPIVSSSSNTQIFFAMTNLPQAPAIPLPPNAPCAGLAGCSAFQFAHSLADGSSIVSETATFTGLFQIWDAQGNLIPDANVDFYDWPQPGAYDYPGMIPEPSASWLVSLGLAALAARHFIRRRAR